MPIIDDFAGLNSGLDSPARHAVAVTPSDAGTLARMARSLWVGGAGAVKVTTAGGEVVTFPAFSGWLPVCVAQVWATGTDAADIVAVW